MERQTNQSDSAGKNPGGTVPAAAPAESPAAAPALEVYINKRELARRTQMRPRTIDDWMKRGLVPYYKVGRSVRFKWSEIEACLAQTCRVCRRSK